MNPKRYLPTLFCLIVGLSLYAQKKAPKQLYVPMDYSTCGYHASEQSIPDVKAIWTIGQREGDCSTLIQQAIDDVARRKPDANGHRGAVVLGEGTFVIDHPLRITASGIVVRGMGRTKTTLVKRGADRGAAIYIEGTAAKQYGTDTLRTTDKAPAGTTTLTVSGHIDKYAVGDRVRIVRPCTRDWIGHLKMEDFGGGLDYTGWKPTDIDIAWNRTITALGGDCITLDAPVTTTLTPEWGAYIVATKHLGELTECGIEDLAIEAETCDWNPKDEDHCWDGIFIDNARDTWVRRVAFRRLAGSAVNLQLSTSRITVEDCIATSPVSEIGGWRRSVFLTRGQQTLFQRCISRQGIHDFAAGYCAAGPNAFVQCEGEESLGFSGSIGSWAAGLLFDIVNIDGSDLRFANLEQFQFGTGWNTANSMFWQCTASTIECYSPDGDNRCSAHGCWGTLTGNGEWTSSNDHVSPRSLFYDQLERRLRARGIGGADPSAFVARLAHILPRSTNATTSPTVEQAMAMARESLTTPRLTMEAWTDSLCSSVNLPLSTAKPFTPRTTVACNATTPSIGMEQAHIVHDGRLITGRQYDIPWWSGRVKDNFVAQGARPAVTRFVPGREGTGWTDRLDSVVGYLQQHHFSSLDHHYGLWYDLRRTDHERVRRADGDVWAPFYEQPFTRSGQGTAWDGLSRYDLTRPNRWYWQRLNDFARLSAPHGLLLFHQHYFQHNILEAGAHWVDCPWRPVNNINATSFPEPVPFAGDKRIFLAEQFYNEQDAVLRPLHRQYIRMCLEQVKEQPNVVHLISAEYTGPTHFTRFWLQTIAEWEAETGRHPMVALSCTKDACDSIMADPALRATVDIVDIRYWHYNTEGLWAPAAGRNMAPRQWMRKMKVGKTGFEEVYRAVREYRDRYPDKAVTYFAQQHPENGWAILFAGGSLPNIPLSAEEGTAHQRKMLSDVCSMAPAEATGCLVLTDKAKGSLVYSLGGDISIKLALGKYDIHAIDAKSGTITTLSKGKKAIEEYTQQGADKGKILWLERKP